jgi:hypothetical protein
MSRVRSIIGRKATKPRHIYSIDLSGCLCVIVSVLDQLSRCLFHFYTGGLIMSLFNSTFVLPKFLLSGNDHLHNLSTGTAGGSTCGGGPNCRWSGMCRTTRGEGLDARYADPRWIIPTKFCYVCLMHKIKSALRQTICRLLDDTDIRIIFQGVGSVFSMSHSTLQLRFHSELKVTFMRRANKAFVVSEPGRLVTPFWRRV